LKGDAASNRRAIGVHVEDGKENTDAPGARFQKFFFIDFSNISNGPVRRCNYRALIGRIGAVWITKESDGIEN
jgi:hypothetical protein